MHLSTDPSRIREALTKTGGNISRAAISLGVTKPYAMWLVRRFDLNGWARTLREDSGAPPTGRPPVPMGMDI